MSVTLLFSVGALTYAQDNPPARQPPPAAREGTPATIRGCLTKGTQAQEYVVADEKSGEKVSFGGPSKLDNYVNQTVEVTGQTVERGGEKAFQPEAIKSVASTCKSAPTEK
jgi:hypothetical protein